MKNGEYTRAMREKHIKRKKRICELYYGFSWYDCDGKYNKGKIHCSCAMCAAKTNSNINKSHGPVNNSTRGFCRLATTNERYGKKNWKPSDKRKIDKCNQMLYDYYNKEECA